ncbi:hypothetical protein RHMOL_Rhmol10G0053000 [Rhododendron molle]|uniref:Uncharacterized protein n=1 Tax=Rhododendron molle TaxID=49168 RepID=A0ACC0M068_RHOML|nr:hypothetical protein RHMOL_Rhmol10G0053000 [Rhododendron molle]
MINRDSQRHSYFIVRSEILEFMKDKQLRKNLPMMFSLTIRLVGLILKSFAKLLFPVFMTKKFQYFTTSFLLIKRLPIKTFFVIVFLLTNSSTIYLLPEIT